MPITVSWDDDEHTILHYEFVGHWKWLDFRDATEEAAKLLDTVNYRVGVIIDALKGSTLADQPLSNIKNAFANPRHRNVGLTAVVVTNMFVIALADAAQKIYWRVANNYDYQFVASLDEARALLRKEGDLGKPHENATGNVPAQPVTAESASKPVEPSAIQNKPLDTPATTDLKATTDSKPLTEPTAPPDSKPPDAPTAPIVPTPPTDPKPPADPKNSSAVK